MKTNLLRYTFTIKFRNVGSNSITFYESQINSLSIPSGFASGRWSVISAYKTAAHPLIFYGGLWRPGLPGKNKILKEFGFNCSKKSV